MVADALVTNIDTVVAATGDERDPTTVVSEADDGTERTPDELPPNTDEEPPDTVLVVLMGVVVADETEIAVDNECVPNRDGPDVVFAEELVELPPHTDAVDVACPNIEPVEAVDDTLKMEKPIR